MEREHGIVTTGVCGQETHLVQWCIKELHIGHADDISGLIFRGVWQKVRGEPVELQSEIERYHKHWRGLGVDLLHKSL